jgi:hypothetical protein
LSVGIAAESTSAQHQIVERSAAASHQTIKPRGPAGRRAADKSIAANARSLKGDAAGGQFASLHLHQRNSAVARAAIAVEERVETAADAADTLDIDVQVLEARAALPKQSVGSEQSNAHLGKAAHAIAAIRRFALARAVAAGAARPDALSVAVPPSESPALSAPASR